MSKIIVFGSTGCIGSEVAKGLAKRGVSFRAVVHSIAKAEQVKNLGPNIDVVEVDLYKPESIETALVGIEKVFFMTPPTHTQAGYPLVDAIKKVGTVKHIVKLSALGVEDNGGAFIWAVEHYQLEEYIRKAGIPLTNLRPSSFMSNMRNYVHSIKSQSIVYIPIGDAKINWISPADIGEAAVKCLLDEGNKHYGKGYNITGPSSVSGAELAKLLSTSIGKEITYKALTNEQLRESLKGRHMPPAVIDGFCDMYATFEKGGYDHHFDDLERVTGSKGQTLTEWVDQHKAIFA